MTGAFKNTVYMICSSQTRLMQNTSLTHTSGGQLWYQCVFFNSNSINKCMYKHTHTHTCRSLHALHLDALSKFEWVSWMIEWKSSDVSLETSLTFIQINLYSAQRFHIIWAILFSDDLKAKHGGKLTCRDSDHTPLKSSVSGRFYNVLKILFYLTMLNNVKYDYNLQ